jgi:anti-anti-sigma regulatory factor
MAHLITIPPILDMEAAVKLHGDWQKLLPNHSKIIVECSHLQQLSTAGLQLLMALKKAFEDAGKQITMRNFSDNIKADLRFLGMDKYFN